MPSEARRVVLVIIGMPDNAARERIAERLMEIDGVKDVHVSLHRGRAVIVHDSRCQLRDLVGAIVHAGYGAALDTAAAGR